MLRDYFAAMSQLKLPLETRILCLLVAAEVDRRDVGVGDRTLRELLAKHGRQLDDATASLEAKRMIAVDPGEGSRPKSYRLRDPAEWAEVRWATNRRRASEVVNILAGARERMAPPETGENSGSLGPLRPGVHRGTTSALPKIVPRRSPGHNVKPLDPVQAGAQRHFAPPSLTDLPISLPNGREIVREGGRELASLTEDEKRLLEAFEVGSGKSVFSGSNPERRLRAIAATANGTFEPIVRAAGDLAGPPRFLDRLETLEKMASAPGRCELCHDRLPVQKTKCVVGGADCPVVGATSS